MMSEDDRRMAAEYALGLLSAEEAREVEARLAQDPEWRDEYALWAEHLAGLSEGIDEVAPPDRLRDEIEAKVFGGENPVSGGSWLWRRFGLGAVLGGVAAMMLLVWFGVVSLQSGSEFDLKAELQSEGGALVVTVGYDKARKVLDLTRRSGQPALGRDFELWLIVGVNAPVSLGVLPETERGLIVVPQELATQMTGATLAISDEPEGGSPTGTATGAVLAVGAMITAS